MSKQLDFNIDAGIFDELIKLQKKLPERATGESKAGAIHAYENPAGLALLGKKDNNIDMVVALKMAGGCWDAPNITYSDMDDGFQALLKADHICAGMALIRHPKWHDSANREDDGKMPQQLKGQLHSMRNSFENIIDTAWIIVQHNYFRVYRPTRGYDGRIGCREITAKTLFDEESKKHAIVSGKLKRDSERKERKKAAKEAQEAAHAKLVAEHAARVAAEEAARALQIEQQRIAQEENSKKKARSIVTLNKRFKDGTESIINAGNGLSFIKGKDGKYILWETSRR